MAQTRLRIELKVWATLSVFAGMCLLASSALAEQPPETNGLAKSAFVQKLMDKFEAARPDAKDLAWFSLDWAATLGEAKERAASEQRPILFLHTNGRGNLYCGFC